MFDLGIKINKNAGLIIILVVSAALLVSFNNSVISTLAVDQLIVFSTSSSTTNNASSRTINTTPAADDNIETVIPLSNNNNNNNNNNNSTPTTLSLFSSLTSTSRFVYVHVGKTGGDTMNKVLVSNCKLRASKKRRITCIEQFDILNHSESQLSKHTMVAIHVQQQLRQPIMKDVTSFLFTIRNPISRAVSAFNMEHPQNNGVSRDTDVNETQQLFYEQCFPTIEDLATVVRNKNKPKVVSVDRNNSTGDCLILGRETLKGNGDPAIAGHLKFNYQFYLEKTINKYPTKEVLVIRTEKFWEDVESLNRALNGTSDEIAWSKGYQDTHGSETYKVKSGLSSEGKVVVCCFLSNENQLYQNLLVQAINLNPIEKVHSLRNLHKDCGIIKEGEGEGEGGGEALLNFSWSQWKDNGCTELR